jgi:hypothetical protein
VAAYIDPLGDDPIADQIERLGLAMTLAAGGNISVELVDRSWWAEPAGDDAWIVEFTLYDGSDVRRD